MPKIEKIKLTDKQFEVILDNQQQINYFNEKLRELGNEQKNYIALILEFNKAQGEVSEINMDNKELILKK